ncbi:phosphotransferase [Kribbella sp. NPDC023972]|uniref:phosphotransferase family protein n=1 Tax=Kribbella sp. NPDC023972 TaxID=3154795 RepID=UPI003407C251
MAPAGPGCRSRPLCTLSAGRARLGARDVLRDRLTTVEGRGGWSTLSRHAAIEALWVRREAALTALDALLRVPTHGDAHPVNLLGRDGDDVIAIDWEQFGLAPAGFDLGYLLLAVDTRLEELLAAYGADADVRRGAVLVAAYSGVSRAAWSLGQPDPGDHVERLARLSAVVQEAVWIASDDR